MSGRRTLLGSLLTALLLALALCGGGPVSAADGVTATATLDGKPLTGANASNPIRLDPSEVAQITIELSNGTGSPITLRRVDLTGHVLGLNFFSYSTAVEMTIAAGETEKLSYRLDPAGLDGQATGLIGADLTVIGSDGKPVAAVATTVDVRGSLLSVYGLFGMVLTVLTALAIADAALTVARHRLSVNRWQRGLRLLAPGIGIGLMIGFTASAARWWVPATGLWLALAGATATVFFLAGYFSPTPDQGDGLDLDAADLAAARELDAHGYGALAPVGSGSDGSRSPTPGSGGLEPRGFRAPEPGSGGRDLYDSRSPQPVHGVGAHDPGASGQRGYRAPGTGFAEPDRRTAPPTPAVGAATPFGPAVYGGAEVGAAEPQRPPGPGWHDPSESPTVRVTPPHRPVESNSRAIPRSRGHRGSDARSFGAPERDGDTLRDIGGTLPDLTGLDRAAAHHSGPPAVQRPGAPQSRSMPNRRAAESTETTGQPASDARSNPERRAADNAETIGHVGLDATQRQKYSAPDRREVENAAPLDHSGPGVSPDSDRRVDDGETIGRGGSGARAGWKYSGSDQAGVEGDVGLGYSESGVRPVSDRPVDDAETIDRRGSGARVGWEYSGSDRADVEGDVVLGYSGSGVSPVSDRRGVDDAETIGRAGSGAREWRTRSAADPRAGEDAETMGYVEPVVSTSGKDTISDKHEVDTETVQFGLAGDRRGGGSDRPGHDVSDARRRDVPDPYGRESDPYGRDESETSGRSVPAPDGFSAPDSSGRGVPKYPGGGAGR
ncbi:hypothetical protein HLB23_31415 [Nocardia uniformis]|uniref:Uncharacterized protein n=1 Tax=Nocardia uniformis TaxID=53432 RepID=A0A849CDQ0_9NOCA|nr:hypothetical protein [Nocardia uniformis]NNH74307.1 hypothetical protein [Nocardia uniformis]